MDAHKTVDKIALEKDFKKVKEDLLAKANENIEEYTKASFVYGGRKGFKLGFIVGLLVAIIIYFIVN